MELLSKQTLEANESHKNALGAYMNKLQAELSAVDRLIAAVEQLPTDDTQEDSSDKWCLHVEYAFKPTPIIDLAKVKDERSPFREDVLERSRYMKATTPNPFSNSEKRYLEKAVVKENKRLLALRAKKNGENAFKAIAGHEDFFLNNTEGIDWAAVARDVSAFNSPLGCRTAQECKVRWIGAQHPRINRRKWTNADEERLNELVESKRGSRIDWEEISQLLGTNRTPLDCIQTYQARSRPSFRWTKDLDKKLIDAVQEYGSSNWTLVATAVSPDVSANQCQIRYGRTLKPDIKRGRFTAEEDQLLLQAVEAYGSDWIKVAQTVPDRTNTQCRERHIHLMAGGTVKAVWSDGEDTRLKNAVKKFGNHWEQVREEMGCVRGRIQVGRIDFVDVPMLLTQRDEQEKVAQGAGEDTSILASQEGPSHELIMTEQKGINDGDIGPASKVDKASGKTKIARGGAKRGRNTVDLPPDSASDALQGDTCIIGKRPRPRPRYKGAMATVSLDPTVDGAASSFRSKRRNIPNKSHSDTSHKNDEAEPQTSEILRKCGSAALEIAAASMADETSDLTDIEDPEDGPPPKKDRINA